MQFLHISAVILSQSCLSPAHRPSPALLSTAPFAPGAKPAFPSEGLSVCLALALRGWPAAAAAATLLTLPSLRLACVFIFQKLKFWARFLWMPSLGQPMSDTWPPMRAHSGIWSSPREQPLEGATAPRLLLGAQHSQGSVNGVEVKF